METLLYNKPSFKITCALFATKFKLLFTKATGYDLMFEASKKDEELTSQYTDKGVDKGKKPGGCSWPLMAQNIHAAI